MSTSRRIPFVYAVLISLITLVWFSTVMAQPTPAEKLIAVAPDDVLGFVAQSGGDSVKPAFEKSVLGKLWRDPGAQRFVEDIKQGLLTKLTEEIDDPDVTEVMDTVRGFVRLLLSRPMVVGVAQKETQDGPPIYGFAILDAGPRKAEIAAALTKLEALDSEGDIVDVQIGARTMHGPVDSGDVPGYWGWVGNHLVFSVNDGTGLAMKYLQGNPRVNSEKLQKVPATGDALAIHINQQKLFTLLEDIARMEGAEDEFAIFQAVMKTLGLSDLKNMTTRMGFDGPDMVSNARLKSAQPRRGLLANFKTIDLALFDVVGADAMNASAFNCDMTGVYDNAMKAAETALGHDFREVQGAIAEVEAELGIEIRDGLLKSLDGQMVFYAVGGGAATGSPQGAFALVAQLKDTRLWEDTLTALGQFVEKQSEGMVQITAQDHGGRTVQTWTIAPLAMAYLMPTWSVVGDKVVIASNPTFFRTAIDQVDSGKPSIRSTPGFQEVTAKLPDNLISFKYSDSKAQFNQMMMAMQQVWPMLTMGAMRAQIKLPMVLPTLSHITEDMVPSCQYSWFDAQGFRSHYQGTGIEPGIGAAAGAGLGLGIMMPALARTRSLSKRMQSGTNLSGLGKAILIYANDYNDELPPNLNALIEKVEVVPRMLESALKPKNFKGPSYLYITGQNISMDPRNILVYENPGFSGDSLNVLYMDSHVAWTRRSVFLRDLKATYKRLGRKMPEVKFANP